MLHLILLHGAIGAKDQLAKLADELQGDFNIHSINFSGHGGSPFPPENFSIDLFADEILEYMQEHHLMQAALFGYSMGGYAAMLLAKKFPRKIQAVVTLATKFNWDESIAAKEISILGLA